MRLDRIIERKDRLAALCTILGFACNQGFVFSLFYMGENKAFVVGSQVFERADLFGTLVLIGLSFVVLRLASPKARVSLLTRSLVWFYAVLLVIGSLVPGLVGGNEAAGLVAECVLIGIPSALMLAAWGRAFGAQPLGRCIVEVFLASGLGAIVCFAVAAWSFEPALLVLKLLPLGSALALRGLLPGSMAADAASGRMTSGGSGGVEREDARNSHASQLSLGDLFSTSEQREETARLSKKIVVGTVLYGLAAGFMETYGSDPGMASTPTFPASLLLFVLFCVAALQFIAPGGSGSLTVPSADASDARVEPEGPLDGVYRLALLVMMAGFLFVPVLSDFGVPGEAIVLAGYLGLTYVLISLFLVMARLTDQDAALSFARGFAALYLGEAAGIGLGNVIDLISQTGQTPYVVVACAGLATLFSYLFLFTERDFRALSVIARDADRFEDVCLLIAHEHGLSKRETEVLPLALRGRTGERIAAELFISKSTVDTHLRRIYAKTGVHGRQELIDLGERMTRSTSLRG